jgi:hypothetical protein
VIEAITPVTRSERASNPLARLIEIINMAKATELNAIAASYEIALTAAEEKYYDAMRELGELALVGAAGENYMTTEQLKPMKYDEAMALKMPTNGTKRLTKNTTEWLIPLYGKYRHLRKYQKTQR